MAYFNGDSEKGLWLYSNRSDIDQLDKYAPKCPRRSQHAVVVTTVGQDGKRYANASDRPCPPALLSAPPGDMGAPHAFDRWPPRWPKA
eukprot:298098-Pyramimonas_sp.AAC.1